MTNQIQQIPLEELVYGRVYRIRARNFRLGVWNGNNGFIGIREKFGNEFLFTEYHWDLSKTVGTAFAKDDLGVDAPQTITISETIGDRERNKDLFDFLKGMEGRELADRIDRVIARYPEVAQLAQNRGNRNLTDLMTTRPNNGGGWSLLDMDDYPDLAAEWVPIIVQELREGA